MWPSLLDDVDDDTYCVEWKEGQTIIFGDEMRKRQALPSMRTVSPLQRASLLVAILGGFPLFHSSTGDLGRLVLALPGGPSTFAGPAKFHAGPNGGLVMPLVAGYWVHWIHSTVLLPSCLSAARDSLDPEWPLASRPPVHHAWSMHRRSGRCVSEGPTVRSQRPFSPMAASK